MFKKMMILGVALTLPLHAVEDISICENNGYSMNSAYYPVEQEGYQTDYEVYPGVAQEHSSYSTIQKVIAFVIGVAFFTLVGVALTNTPHNHRHRNRSYEYSNEIPDFNNGIRPPVEDPLGPIGV